MVDDMAGKTALVTGGSKGIGRAIATVLAEAGARVMISSRKEEDLKAAAEQIRGEVAIFPANAGDHEQAASCVQACVEEFGSLDILVNKALLSVPWVVMRR